MFLAECEPGEWEPKLGMRKGAFLRGYCDGWLGDADRDYRAVLAEKLFGYFQKSAGREYDPANHSRPGGGPLGSAWIHRESLLKLHRTIQQEKEEHNEIWERVAHVIREGGCEPDAITANDFMAKSAFIRSYAFGWSNQAEDALTFSEYFIRGGYGHSYGALLFIVTINISAAPADQPSHTLLRAHALIEPNGTH